VHDMQQNALQLGSILLFQVDDAPFNAMKGVGTIYFLSLPFAALGLWRTLADIWKTFGPSFVFLSWFVASVLLSILINASINQHNAIYFPLIFFTAMGVAYIWRWPTVRYAVIASYIGCFLWFVSEYFGPFQSQISYAFFESFGPAVWLASTKTQGPICITADINQPYIFVLFYTEADPRTFLQTVQYRNPGDEFQRVASFDRYTFGKERCRGKSFDAYVFTNGDSVLPDQSTYETSVFKHFSVALRR
jgi:hypothetical protein